MHIIEIFSTLIILFVAINLIWAIYQKIYLKIRLGFDTLNSSCVSGCTTHKNINGDCDNKIYKDGEKFYRKCSYSCPGPNDIKYDPDQECEYNQNCKSCGTFRIETNSMGYDLNQLNQPDQPNQSKQVNQAFEAYKAKQANQANGLFDKSKKYSDDNQNYESQSPSLINSASNLFSEGESWASDETQKLKNSASYLENKIMGNGDSTQDSNTDLGRVPTRQTPTRAEYKSMGKKFLDDESKRKGINSPPILDSESEVMGRLVWRVYLAEKYQKKALNSPESKQKTMERETQLINKLSQIYRTHSDYQKINSKQSPLYKNSTNVNTDSSSRAYTTRQTTGTMSSVGTGNSGQSHHLSIVRGYEISGSPLPNHTTYTNLSTAVDKCGNDGTCGGINVSNAGHYTLMPTHESLKTKKNHIAYVKTSQHNANNIDIRKSETSKSKNSSRTTSLGNQTQSRYNGLPRDPKLAPTPYNSLMNLFS